MLCQNNNRERRNFLLEKEASTRSNSTLFGSLEDAEVIDNHSSPQERKHNLKSSTHLLIVFARSFSKLLAKVRNTIFKLMNH